MLEKADALLGSFGTGRPLTLRELGERTGLARSTVHRLMIDLTALRWVHRDGNRYALGLRLLELGELVPAKRRLRSSALPFMQDLFVATGETVHLAVRDGADVVYVDKIHGHTALSLPSRTGGQAPLTCTAVGKALLAHESEDVLQDVLSRPLRRWTSSSLTNPAMVVDQLNNIRRTGLAHERGEATPGGACIATPIMVWGRPVAALSLATAMDRFAPERLGPALLTASFGLSRTLSAASL